MQIDLGQLSTELANNLKSILSSNNFNVVEITQLYHIDVFANSKTSGDVIYFTKSRERPQSERMALLEVI